MDYLMQVTYTAPHKNISLTYWSDDSVTYTSYGDVTDDEIEKAIKLQGVTFADYKAIIVT